MSSFDNAKQYKLIRPSITVDTSAYVAGDVVGGIITLTGALCYNRTTLLKSVVLTENGGQTPALSLMLFRATPVGGTYTDNSGVAFAAADLTNFIDVVRIGATDWYVPSGSSKAFCAIGDLNIVCDGSSTSDDLYMLIVADGAYDAVAAADLKVRFGFDSR